MSDPDGGEPSPSFTGRAAFAISQVYYYVAATIGVGFLVGGAIATLIGLRQLIFGASPGDFGGTYVEAGTVASRDALRSILGGLAFAVPGGLVFLWHIREARRRERAFVPGAFWGSALYFHLVAAIALPVALGGLVAGLHALRDAALPSCYSAPEPYPAPDPYPSEVSPVPGISPPVVEIPEEAAAAFEDLRRDCYPPTGQALRSALDAAIVAGVAAGVWGWHLRRGRREAGPPPAAG
ncbi:MAG TPA: hypothetical protein VF108_03965 [Actinomycetota bacterium]